ncbi:response regulator [Halovivax sp.]|uniref:response regulator n=1 Tax=Halovivax sp. TaxID=1935978 RepID=UPI0025C68553|nr:response regulator [Halovivax sp.]
MGDPRGGGPTDPRGTDAADVLLVEDNPGDVRLVREAFEDGVASHRLHVVEDGRGALDFCARRGEHADAPRPDLVLLDQGLPGRSGEEVLAALHADPDLRSLPVVVLTGSRADADAVRSYRLAANAVVTKPVDPDEYMETIRTIEEFWLSMARLPAFDE